MPLPHVTFHYQAGLCYLFHWEKKQVSQGYFQKSMSIVKYLPYYLIQAIEQCWNLTQTLTFPTKCSLGLKYMYLYHLYSHMYPSSISIIWNAWTVGVLINSVFWYLANHFSHAACNQSVLGEDLASSRGHLALPWRVSLKLTPSCWTHSKGSYRETSPKLCAETLNRKTSIFCKGPHCFFIQMISTGFLSG